MKLHYFLGVDMFWMDENTWKFVEINFLMRLYDEKGKIFNR